MYQPEYEGPVKGWAIKYALANFWRVEATLTMDDMNQEAYLTFQRCVKKCPVAKTPSQFMALFKTAWTNQVNDLATSDTRYRAQASDRNAEPMGSTENDGYLAILIKEAPAEVKAVLNLFLNAPTEILEMALGKWLLTDRRKIPGRSKRICRMLGLDEGLDVLQMVEDHFLDRR